MTKTFIGIVPNLESKQIVIAKWKTMEEAIEFAKKNYGFTWDHLTKAEWNNNCRIGTMDKWNLEQTELNEKLQKITRRKTQ